MPKCQTAPTWSSFCDCAVYLPDPLAGRRFVLGGDFAADVADTEALARLLLLCMPRACLAKYLAGRL